MPENTKDDIDFMVRWFRGVCMLSAQDKTYTRTEQNEAVQKEIEECIKASLIGKRKTK